MDSEYWKRWQQRKLGRRSLLAGAGAASAGVAGLALVGCGDDDDDDGGGDGGSSGAGNTPPPAGVAGTATPSGETPTMGGNIRYGTYLDVLGVDPHIEVSIGLIQGAKVYTHLGNFNYIDQTFNSKVSEKLENPSPNEFIFQLRKDVKFANKEPVNGRQLTAEDVLYSFERFRDLPKAQNNDYFKTVTDKMEVIDQYTFKLTTKTPFAESLTELGSIQKMLVAREDVEKKGDLTLGGVGAGAYTFESYEKGRGTVLVRNPDYFGKPKPYPDKLSWQVILDQSTLFEAYKSGQFDQNGTALTKIDYDDLKRDPNLINDEKPGLNYGSLGLNASAKPLDNPMVRQAIWIGIDRKQVVDKVYQGSARRMAIISPGLDFWALPDKELDQYLNPNYDEAKKLLSAAGYPNGFELEVDTSNGVQAYVDHLEVITPELKKIGITIKPQITDLTTFLNTKLFNGGARQAVIFTHNPYESPKIPLGFYHTKGIGNGSWFHYSNPNVDAAIEKQAAELDIAKRKELVYEAQRTLLNDWPPLVNMTAPSVFQSRHKRVGGVDFKLGTYYTATTLNEFIKPA